MAQGALARAGVDLTVAITGVAGPGGGSAEKPVGLVHFAAAAKDGRLIHREKRYGDIGRSEVRRLSVIEALEHAAGACPLRSCSWWSMTFSETGIHFTGSCSAQLLAQDRADDVGIVVGPGRDFRRAGLLPALCINSPTSASRRASTATSALARKSLAERVRLVVGLAEGHEAFARGDRRDDLGKLHVAVRDVHQDHAMRREARQVAAQRFAREQVHRNGVGGKRVEHDQVELPRRSRKRQARVAEHDPGLRGAACEEAEHARIARKPDDLRVDLEEGPALAVVCGDRRGSLPRGRPRRRCAGCLARLRAAAMPSEIGPPK